MPTEFTNRVVKISDGSYVYWKTVGSADQSLSASNAPSPSSDYSNHVVVSRQPARPEIFQENLSSQSTGSVSTFTTSRSYRPGTLAVRWNGQVQSIDEVTEVTETTFSLSLTPDSGDAIEVVYRPA
jgi:hypothetical protein